ncbi:hydroxymethylglutaryl-coenzyme A synthase C terminal-domain-containing protein [Cladochytrium replicatum]|nr:hydroxymethylglutaryl-coenzyme A synthase C terminal-domain-containing protein [Cladochytrium replicatum]
MLASQYSSESDNPHHFGILAIESYIPKLYVAQSDLEIHDNVPQGKYTIGLGQLNMAVVSDREDINSVSLTVVQNLLERNNIDPSRIARVEVGTETIIDKSKSVKSVLMPLFYPNSNIEGIDTTNACYGATNALFNTMNYLQSSAYDGTSLCIVVAADIAVYKAGSARPTGGAGAVAMLIGPGADLVFEPKLRVTHIEHAYDFYKPDLHSEFPEVDGPATVECYLRGIDTCYSRYLDHFEKLTGETKVNALTFPYALFHTPYNKLISKAYGRFFYNDLLRHPDSFPPELATTYASTDPRTTYFDKNLEKAMVDHSKAHFKSHVGPGLLLAQNVGNMYCASLYGTLCSLLSTTAPQDLAGKRVLLFSYGSGLASSMFSMRFRNAPESLHASLDVASRLASRTRVEATEYERLMALREKTHNVRSYVPVTLVEPEKFWDGTFVLEEVDQKFRRRYSRVGGRGVGVHGGEKVHVNGKVNGVNGVNGVH